jgi:hypothetical protein
LQQLAARVSQELERLPDYACRQNVERFGRFGSERPWDKVDTLQLEVGLVNQREMYSWAGARQFQESELSELVGRGVVGTGHYALLAKHVFQPGGGGQFRYKGVTETDGREAHEWSFDFPLEKSRYRLRTARAEAVVPFQGTIWADAKTLSLLRLEAHAYDLPESLALVEASNTIRYQPVAIGDREITLPIYSEVLLVFTDGNENLNRQKLTECRQFRGEAVLSFAEAKTTAEPKPRAEPSKLPPASVLEVELADGLEPSKGIVGQTIRIKLSRDLKDGEKVLAAAGADGTARLVRLEKQDLPYPIWEIGLELDTIRIADGELPVNAVLIDAGPESGLLRQSKRFMPTFTKRRNARMDILVRETPKGQGILHWDAKRPQVPKGLRMKWRIE